MTQQRRTGSTSRHSTTIGLRRELIDAVAVLLGQAKSALVITGPAMMADSGLHNYRGFPGLHHKRPDYAKAFEAALSIETLRAKPELTWKYLLAMDAAVRAVEPNRGHEVLVQLGKKIPRFTVMTTNVDRLLQRAGARNVIEMHGALHDLLCTTCELSQRHQRFDRLKIPPKCATCGSVLRPDMPLFGEPLPADPFTRLQAELDAGFDIVFSVGVGTMFPYLARPLLVAKSEGIPTIEIGVQPTELSEVVDFRFRGRPVRVLDLIAQVYEQLASKASRAK
jgi:NAD-dependent deacetylase